MVSSLSAGFAVGFAVAAPIGPMGILCIQRTLAQGMRAGLATGLGAATVHAAYGAAGVLGVVASVKVLVASNAWTLQLLSAALLAWFAVRLVARRGGDVAEASVEEARLSRHYRSAVALGLTNPLTFLLLLAAVPALADGGSGPEALLGLVLGSVSWWVILSGGIGLVRGRVDRRFMRGINVACAACLLVLAAGSVRTALGPQPHAMPAMPAGAVAEAAPRGL